MIKVIHSFKCRQTTQKFGHVLKHFVKMIVETNRSFIFVLIIWIPIQRGNGDENRGHRRINIREKVKIKLIKYSTFTDTFKYNTYDIILITLI